MNTLAILVVASVLLSCSIAAENRDRRQSYGGLSTGGGIPDYAVEYNGFNPVIPTTTSGYSGGNIGDGYSGTGNGYNSGTGSGYNSGTGSGYSGTGSGYNSGTGNGYNSGTGSGYSGTGNGNYGYNNGGGYRRGGNNRRGNGNRGGYGNNYNPNPIIIQIDPPYNGYNNNNGYNSGGGSSNGNTGYGR